MTEGGSAKTSAAPHAGATSVSTAGLRAAGAVTAALGLVALLGWILRVPSFSTMGSDLIPMAPSTALLFVLNGLAVWLLARPAPGRRVWLATAAAAGVSIGVAAVVLALRSFEIYPTFERLGLAYSGELRGILPGYMSPVTAVSFLLAGFSMFVLMPRPLARPWSTGLAGASASLLLGTSLVFLLAYLYGEPLLYGGRMVPPALNTALAFASLAAGLLGLAFRQAAASDHQPERARSRGQFVLVFVVAAALMVSAGHLYYRSYDRQFRAEVGRQLSSIAELKVGELTQWRKERLGDGRIFFENANFSARVRRCLDAPRDPQQEAPLRAWLRQIHATSHYDRVFVTDIHGVEIVSYPAAAEPGEEHMVASVSESLRSGRVSLLDLHRGGPGRPIHMAVLVPIFDVEGDSRPLGALVLRIDPSASLYPFIQRWPIPSGSAETLLVRREGGDALVLNELRFHKDAALALRVSLGDTRMPSARAARGQEGVVEGLDVHGGPAIAALRAVPDSPWYLVARMDVDEAFGPLRERLWELALMVAVLLSCLGAGLVLVWRLQGISFYRERYLAAEALRASEARVRAIYDHLPNPTFVWKREAAGFVLAAFNDAARTASRGQFAGLIGLGAGAIPDPLPDLSADLDRCYRARAPIRRELDYASPLSDAPRRVVATYGFIPPDMVLLHTEDVTKLRRTEGQLRLAQRMEAIGSLAGGVAHDFNNLLSVILGSTEFAMAAVRKRDPVYADLLEIYKAGERAASLTRQLLAFSRKQILQPQVLSLNRVIGGMEEMVRRLLREDIELVMALSADLGSVTADPGQIEQVVLNLAVNARDAMPEGGTLTIATANVEFDADAEGQHVGLKPGEHVMLSVTDTGLGMDRDTQARIFEPFFTTKEPGRGTGLGLATVYGIVKQSGGSIRVDSEPGKGAAFTIYLPRELSAPEPAADPEQGPARSTGGETIVVVEDEEAVREVAGRILREAGYTVLAAANGAEALVLCERYQGRIDLVLTDLVMPQMSGKDLAGRLATECPDVPVVFISGYADAAIFHDGKLDPGIRFVSKPFTIPSLTRAVRAAIDEARRA